MERKQHGPVDPAQAVEHRSEGGEVAGELGPVEGGQDERLAGGRGRRPAQIPFEDVAGDVAREDDGPFSGGSAPEPRFGLP